MFILSCWWQFEFRIFLENWHCNYTLKRSIGLPIHGQRTSMSKALSRPALQSWECLFFFFWTMLSHVCRHSIANRVQEETPLEMCRSVQAQTAQWIAACWIKTFPSLYSLSLTPNSDLTLEIQRKDTEIDLVWSALGIIKEYIMLTVSYLKSRQSQCLLCLNLRLTVIFSHLIYTVCLT